ncbi:ATP-binding protein [Niallia sp. 03133]|uniref:ATP-binding protein n=1 Tax=Niallia sp. 03133 TaxID=3458060 RepID=UPI004043FF19
MFAKPALDQKEKIIIYKEILQVVNILTRLANLNNVEIQLCHEKQESHNVLGDGKKLEQALVNIVKYGIESTTNGGEVYIDVEYSSHLLYIKISDNGKGMTQKQIDRLVEPYFTTKEKGTGLGMMVSFSIIQSMGGRTNINSEINKGTILLIELPIVSD